jgi:hypothetical protein
MTAHLVYPPNTPSDNNTGNSRCNEFDDSIINLYPGLEAALTRFAILFNDMDISVDY